MIVLQMNLPYHRFIIHVCSACNSYVMLYYHKQKKIFFFREGKRSLKNPIKMSNSEQHSDMFYVTFLSCKNAKFDFTLLLFHCMDFDQLKTTKGNAYSNNQVINFLFSVWCVFVATFHNIKICLTILYFNIFF